MNSGVRKQTGIIYGFVMFGGSLVRDMKGGNGPGPSPGQKRPSISEIFTPTFTPNGVSRVGLKPPGVLGGAISGFLAPVKAGKMAVGACSNTLATPGHHLDTSTTGCCQGIVRR